jgi:hypothetical protein
VSAPFGRIYPASANTLFLVTLGPATLVAKVASPIAAYNVAVLSGLALTGASMYLLVRWLGLGMAPALWAGLSFVLFPYELVRASGHVPFSHLECFPLMLMAAVHWVDGPSRRRVVLLALAVALGWLTNPYYGLMCTIIAATAIVWTLVVAVRRGGLRTATLRAAEAAAGLMVLVGLPLLALLASTRGALEESFERDPAELVIYGARLTDYVRPIVGNPLWTDILGDPLPSPMGERVNYLGAVTIALALIGLVAAFHRRTEIGSRARTGAALGIPVAAVLIWFSLASPSTWFGASIEMPASLVFDAAPFLRAFARFAPAVMAVALTFGAIGLWALIRRRGDLARVCIVVTVLLATAIELPTRVPIGSAQPAAVGGRAPADVPTWAWLSEHERDALVFEFPGRPNEQIERYYMYAQISHGHRILNGNLFPDQLGYAVESQVGMPAWPNTAPWLRALGVDLVTINPWAFALAGAEAPDPRHPPAGYALVAAFADGSAIWRVTARPADAVPVFRREGWWAQEHGPDGRLWRWMTDEGHLTIVAAEPGDTYRMSFDARGLDPAATYPLEITAPDGRVTRVVVRGQRRVTMTLRMSVEHGDVVVRNLGPPARQMNQQDPRLVSVMVSEPTLTRVDVGDP